MLELRAITERSLVSLRVVPKSAEEASNRLNLAAPLRSSVSNFESRWLGPAHWLLLSEGNQSCSMIDYCDEKLEGLTYNATDQSDAMQILRVGGSAVRELLASGCGLDFRPASFELGVCQSTRFAQVHTTICACAGEQFELLFDRSYGDYLQIWLKDSYTLCSAFTE